MAANTEMKLPPQENPQTRKLAQELRSSVDSDEEFVDAVLDKFNREPYVYTLQPGRLSAGDQDRPVSVSDPGAAFVNTTLRPLFL